MIAATELALWAVRKVQTPAIPYVTGGESDSGTDCARLVRWGIRELTGAEWSKGSNTAWRNDFTWRGTIAEAKASGNLIPGAIVYMDYGNPKSGGAGTDGKMDHMGIYVGFGYGIKNPEGKPADVVHASQSKGGVYGSILDKNAWTHVALHKGLSYFVTITMGGGAGEAATETGGSEMGLTGKNCTALKQLNMRAKATQDSSLVCRVPSGKNLLCLGEGATYSNVRYEGECDSTRKPGTYTGYVLTEGLEEIDVDGDSVAGSAQAQETTGGSVTGGSMAGAKLIRLPVDVWAAVLSAFSNPVE